MDARLVGIPPEFQYVYCEDTTGDAFSYEYEP